MGARPPYFEEIENAEMFSSALARKGITLADPVIIPLRILGDGGRLLFQVNADGTAEGEVADASEAARAFAACFADELRLRGAIVGAPADPEAFG